MSSEAEDDDRLSFGEEDLEIIEEPATTEQPDENATNDNENEQDGENRKEIKIKRVRNPQPKLNADTLRGPRGLQALDKLFTNVQFKGQGCEEEDLTLLMKNYEYWCHRLFPKLPFDDCLERIERLGAKKPVQTYIKKIRMDMLNDDDDDDRRLHEDDMDQNNVDEEGIQNSIVDDVVPQIDQPQDMEPSQQKSVNQGLTDEQLERIKINRERAQRLRQQMLIRKKLEASGNVNTSNDSPDTSMQSLNTLNKNDESMVLSSAQSWSTPSTEVTVQSIQNSEFADDSPMSLTCKSVPNIIIEEEEK